MAGETTTSSKWVFTYQTTDGSSTTHTYRYADTTAETSDLNTVATTTITNGSIFAKVPTTLKSAKLVTTTETTKI